jgi:hypothetical protein
MLPNYFLAGLPPDAELTPMMITAACETLKRNREKYLAHRKTEDLVNILCEVAAGWLQPDGKFRRLAVESGPEATGFSKAILEKGLDGFFRRFTPENFQALLKQDLGEDVCAPGVPPPPSPHEPRSSRHEEAQTLFHEFQMEPPHVGCHGSGVQCATSSGKSHPAPIPRHFWHGPQMLVHIAAGNVPNPALMSLTLGLLTRSAQFMKCASGASLLPGLFAHSLYEADPKLGACLELAEWRGGNPWLETALFAEADCVTATGSDETLAAIRSRLPAKVRFLGHGQRVSFGFVTREVLREETIAEIVSRVADDVVAWDQNGCLSPHVIYVEERGAVESDKFAGLLAAELMKREETGPRGKISVAESADIASRRSVYETLAAHRGDVKIWQSQNSTAWTVVFEHEVRFHFSPLNRFVFVKPVPGLSAVLQGVDELEGKISTVGIAAAPGKLPELAAQLARRGVTRICPAGQMQNPPLTWRHDGRPALGDLVTWTDVEIEPQVNTDGHG